MAKELLAVQFLLESGALHGVLSAIKGKAYNVQIAAVESPEHLNGIGKSGRTTQASARAVLWPWIVKQGAFTNAEAVAHGEANSLSRSAILNMIAKLHKNGLTKRDEPGHYVVTAKGKKAAAAPNGKEA